MGINFNELRILMRDGAREAFSGIQTDHPDEQFYAFALYTDDSADSLLPAANSEQGYQRTVERYSATDARELAYLRWSTAEWAYEAFDVSKNHFRGVRECLSSLDRSWPDESFVAFRQQYFATMINALLDLETEGFFGVGDVREKVTVFATVSDSELAEGLEKKSVRKINPRSVYQRFIHRFS